MPELPEVETLRRGLEREASQRRILDVRISRPELLRGQEADEFRGRVVGSCLERFRRRGKYLLLDLEPHDPPVTLCIHLKMRGQLRLVPHDEPDNPYQCLAFLLDNGMSLRYNDVWRWGEVRALTQTEQDLLLPLGAMGPEPLGTDWQVGDFAVALAKRRGPIKAVLLDQSLVAGVGNIYADEALFAAGLHPRRPANSLGAAEVEHLHSVVRKILANAADMGGTTSEEFLNLAGLPGRFRPAAYNRPGAICDICETVMEKTRIGGRGTTFCSHCQR